jgi:hypothetical protein
MRPDTIDRALQHLPCTAAELGAKLGRSQSWGLHVACELVKRGHAEKWGDKLTDKGTLAPVLHAKGAPHG